MTVFRLIFKISSRVLSVSVISFTALAYSFVFAEANNICTKVLVTETIINEFKARQVITDLDDLDPQFAINLREKIQTLSETSLEQRRDFVKESWAKEGLSETEISELLSQSSQHEIDAAFIGYVQQEIDDMYLQSLARSAASRPALKRSEATSLDQGIANLNETSKSDIKANEVYNISLTSPLVGQRQLRIRFSPQAVSDLMSENSNDGDLVKALSAGYTNNGKGIQPMKEAQVFLNEPPAPSRELSVFRVKPKGISSYRWVMAQLPNGEFLIIRRLHKDDMQNIRIELDARQISISAR